MVSLMGCAIRPSANHSCNDSCCGCGCGCGSIIWCDSYGGLFDECRINVPPVPVAVRNFALTHRLLDQIKLRIAAEDAELVKANAPLAAQVGRHTRQRSDTVMQI